MKKFILSLALIGAMVGCAPKKDANQLLTEKAAAEYLDPVHPGNAERPFWNVFAKKFMYAPAFGFRSVEGAVKYRYVATADDGQSWTFIADTPQHSLAPIWNDIPQGTNVTLCVEGLNAAGEVVATVGERKFWRDYAFNPPYNGAVRSYREAAIMGMLHVHKMPEIQHWLNSTEPDMNYNHNTYPCKIIGATIQVEVLLAKTVPSYHDAAVTIAKNAAQFLMDQARKPGDKLAYFPPTYYKDRAASKYSWNQGKTMAMEAASAGEAYLDLYDITGESIYLEQAIGIANTYCTLQNEDGSWHIKYDFATGEPVNDVKAMLHPLLRYFLRLEQNYGQSQYAEARIRGEKWMSDHILKSFDMTGQFEDVNVLGLEPYQNLTNCTAAPYATYLLLRGANEADLATAYELVRFSEDQFVYWDCPLNEDGVKRDSCPCVFEQYKYAMPVDNSASNVANAMLDIYDHCGDELMRAKAQALIDNITVVQCVNTGKLLTTWRLRYNYKPTFWINCAYDSMVILLRLSNLP